MANDKLNKELVSRMMDGCMERTLKRLSMDRTVA